VYLYSEAEWKTWLTGPVADALVLQKPLPDGTLKIAATGLRKDGRAA
jgi:hypothetical protein